MTLETDPLLTSHYEDWRHSQSLTREKSQDSLLFSYFISLLSKSASYTPPVSSSLLFCFLYLVCLFLSQNTEKAGRDLEVKLRWVHSAPWQLSLYILLTVVDYYSVMSRGEGPMPTSFLQSNLAWLDRLCLLRSAKRMVHRALGFPR